MNKKKRNSIEPDDETMEMIRKGAKSSSRTQKAYVKLCIIRCQSDRKEK